MTFNKSTDEDCVKYYNLPNFTNYNSDFARFLVKLSARRGDRAVEGARLERVCASNRTQGSNPCLSARTSPRRIIPAPLTTQDTRIWYKGPSRVPWHHIATVCLVTSPLQCHNHHRFYPASYIDALLGFSYFAIVNASNYAVLQLCVTLSPKQQSGGSFQSH